MNFVKWKSKNVKKIGDMNSGDVFISDSNLWMVSDSDNGVNRFAIRLKDGEFGKFNREHFFEMCIGEVNITVGGLD